MNNKQFENVLNCSELMLKDAQVGNWNNVIEFETQRRELLDKLFSAPYQNKNVDDMDNKIRKIIAINNKLEDVALKAREDARNSLSAINKGRNAISLYGKNSV